MQCVLLLYERERMIGSIHMFLDVYGHHIDKQGMQLFKAVKRQKGSFNA